MRKCLVFVMFALLAVTAPSTKGQTAGTSLVINAQWNNNTNIQGTVTLAKMASSTSQSVIVAKTLVNGHASVTESLDPNSLYTVTLRLPNGSTLLEFPITTALINPQNLQNAEITIVCRTTDHSIASARIGVFMTF